MNQKDIELLAEVGLDEACNAIQEEMGKKFGVVLGRELAGVFFSDGIARNNLIAYVKAELAGQHWADEPKLEGDNEPLTVVQLEAAHNSIISDPDQLDNATNIFDALVAQGVDEITVRYYGGGDEGGIQDVDANPPQPYNATAIINGQQGTLALDDAIRDLSYALIYDLYSGYENNEGGGGTLTYNVQNRTIELDHYYCEVKEDYQDTQRFSLK